jgi:hypothetical protein
MKSKAKLYNNGGEILERNKSNARIWLFLLNNSKAHEIADLGL